MLKGLWVIFFLKQKKCCKIEKLGMGADVGLAAFFCGESIRTMNVMGADEGCMEKSLGLGDGIR